MSDQELRKRVYQAFAPEPLQVNELDLYVNLDKARGDSNLVERLAEKIRLSDKPTCQVLAGHKGSGKSTELSRLTQSLQSGNPRFFVVRCDTKDEIDLNDVDYMDVLILIIRNLAQQLRENLRIELQPGYFKDRLRRLYNLLGREIDFAGLEWNAGLAKLSLTLKNSPDARLDIRKFLEPDTSNWIEAANDVIGEAISQLNAQGWSGLLILVDDLDKLIVHPHTQSSCDTDVHLFVNRAPQLTAFLCHVLYTIPISLAYSHHEQAIKKFYNEWVPVLPMTRVMRDYKADQPDEKGVSKFRDIVDMRLNRAMATRRDVFADDKILDELILLSGGQPTELMSYTREALVSHGLPLNDISLRRVQEEGKREYERFLRVEHWPIIREVRAKGNFSRTNDNEGIIKQLLDCRAVLQYRNHNEWYGLNPMIRDIATPPPPPV